MNQETPPFFKLLSWFGLFIFGHVLAIFIWSWSLPDPKLAMNILQVGFTDISTYKNELFNLQFITHLTTFLLVAIFYITYVEKKNINTFLGFTVPLKPIFFPLMLVLLFSCQPVIMLLVEGFKQLPMPAEWSQYIQLSHDNAEATTKSLLIFDSPFQFLMGILMVGVFAGIGEEITFRGIIQKIFKQWFKNIHLAIIASSFIFAILHGLTFNLFGIWFIGALLGYVYHYTGNLWISILFHFLNNTIQVVSIYLFQRGIIPEDYSSKEYYSLALSLGAIIISSTVMFLFKKYRNPNFDDHQFITLNNTF